MSINVLSGSQRVSTERPARDSASAIAELGSGDHGVDFAVHDQERRHLFGRLGTVSVIERDLTSDGAHLIVKEVTRAPSLERQALQDFGEVQDGVSRHPQMLEATVPAAQVKDSSGTKNQAE